MIPASLYTILFNIAVLFLVLGALLILWRAGERRSYALALGLGLLILVLLVFAIFYYTGSQFGLMRLAAWVCFVHVPLYLLGLGVIFRGQAPQISTGHVMLACVILVIGVDAFMIETHWLDVTRMTVPSSKIDTVVRLVLIADIQTDRISAYEERALATGLAQEPDLLLFAGDYIHLAWNSQEYVREIANLNALLRGFDLHVPLCAYAIAGNVDAAGVWSQAFSDIPVVAVGETTSYDLGPVYLTALGLHDAFQTRISLPEHDKFHIVLGHSPNFSLGDVRADLLLAGHTHGGQVRLPFVGPI